VHVPSEVSSRTAPKRSWTWTRNSVLTSAERWWYSRLDGPLSVPNIPIPSLGALYAAVLVKEPGTAASRVMVEKGYARQT
jgi:hypothetical protein